MKRWIHDSEHILNEYMVEYIDNKDHRYLTVVDAVDEKDAREQIEDCNGVDRVLSVYQI